MIVTQLELSSDGANNLVLPLRDASSDARYKLKAWVGLDADELLRKFYAFGAQSTKRFNQFGINKREVVLRIELNPTYSINETVSDLRDNVYRMISSSRNGIINMLFSADGALIAGLSGYMTKFEVPHFSEVPELQITINCDDGILRGTSPVVLDSNDLSSSSPLYLPDSSSTAPHGMSIEVVFTATTASFTVQSDASNPDWAFTVTPDNSFLSGDILHISSEYGNKQVYMDRSSTITYLLDKVDPTSIWPLIFPGTNEFHFPEIANFNWNEIQYRSAYWGV